MKSQINIKIPPLKALIFLITIISCQNTIIKDLPENEPDDSVNIVTPANEVKIEKPVTEDKSAETDNTKKLKVESVVPQNVLDYIEAKLPGWEIPDTSEYVKYWWDFYDRDKITYFVNTDLNMDGFEDYAITMKTGNILKLVFILRTGDTFSHLIANDFSEVYTGKGLKYGILIEPPGRTDRVVNNKEVTLILRHNGVALMKEEIMIRIYYWKDDKFQVFYTI